jgi:hypothetical protein
MHVPHSNLVGPEREKVFKDVAALLGQGTFAMLKKYTPKEVQ